jgi:putative heme iron utilization protein
MTDSQTPAITPRGTELGGAAPANFDAVAMARRALRRAGTAALATLDPVSGFPLATLVNVATDVDGTPLFLASRLALHTRNLDADPRASLLFATLGKGDPMANSERLSVAGRALRCEDANARRRFLARHPKAKLYIDFPDFSLFRLDVAGMHPNGGFARAGEIEPGDVLLDLTGCDELVAGEADLLAQLNAERSGLLGRCAVAAGLAEGRWRATGIDPEGLDLLCGDTAARLLLPGRATSAEAVLTLLAGLGEASPPQS